MEVDPVCGMKVDVDTALCTIRDGVAYYFCSESCLAELERHFEDYRVPPKAMDDERET